MVSNETRVEVLAAAIDRLERDEPRSPEALESRLDYADLLARATGGDCLRRLDHAQAELDIVAAKPVVEIVLPLGRARIADIEYRIHLGRSSCEGDPSVRQHELRAALDAAQRATDGYREALDYPAMAVMQFNIAVTFKMLGDDHEALAALESAIDMDHEYGFREDAADNYTTLLGWKSAPNGADQVAALMKDFPRRSTTLKFGWVATDAHVSLETHHARAVDSRVAESRAVSTLRRHIRASGEGWIVSVEPGMTRYDPAAGLSDAAELKNVTLLFARSLPRLPDIAVSRTGDFRGAVDADKFAAQMSADAQALIRSRGADRVSGAQELTDRALEAALAPQVIEAKAAEGYNLETAAWIGATLEQGVWYEMRAPLSMPGTPRGVVMHSLAFSFTRTAPCTTSSTARSCVEIVVRATPEADALDDTLAKMARAYRLRRSQKIHYAAAICLRITTDPETLLPYGMDTRRYSYLRISETGPNSELIESEKSVSASSYQ